MFAARRARLRATAVLAVSALAVAGCRGSSSPSTHGTSRSAAATTATTDVTTPAPASTTRATYPTTALRRGEHFHKLALSAVYKPHAAVGTDDYRCFLIDPHLTRAAYLTGVTFEPDQVSEVHHAILYRVDPAQVTEAKRKDAADPGQGWSCFGSAGLNVLSGTGGGVAAGLDALRSAPWLAAWAPGGKEQLYAHGVGVPMQASGQIVLQVHYNLLGGSRPDRTAVRLRLASATTHLKALRTMLLPAPVELPCTSSEHGPLCDRNASLLDLVQRFGNEAGATVGGLQLLCGGNFIHPREGSTQSCDRRIDAPVTIQAAAGHMHLLGKSIKITLDPGTAHARTLLNIPVWDFDDQGARTLPHPVVVKAGANIRVTCTHDASLHQKLPALRNLPPRYVTWGDGSTDEMCLGILLYTNS
jgi:hypothetical protein